MLLDLSWRRWRNQAVVWLLLIAILAVVAVAVRTFLDYRAAAIDLLLARDQKLTYLSAARLRDELSKFADSLDVVARTQAVYGGDPETQRLALQQAQPVQEGLFDGGIVLLDNFGEVIAVEPPFGEILGEDWSDREQFRRMLTSSSTYFSDVTDDPRSSSKVVMVSVPVIGEGGQFVGVLSGILLLGESTISPLYATIVRLRVGQENGNIFVLDQDGTVLFDSLSQHVGQSYQNAALAETVLSRQPGALRANNSEQEPIIASFAPIPGTEWTLVVEDNWQTVTADTQRYLRLLIVLLAVGVLLVAVGAFLLIRRLHSGARNHELNEDATVIANKMVQMLLPSALPVIPGWDVTVHFRVHSAVEGDFYDVMLLRDGGLMVAVGKINASGVAGSVILAIARTVLRSAARKMLAPAEALAHSNDFLCAELSPEHSVSCLYAILEPSTGHLRFANAGSNVPTYRNGDGVALIGSTGIPLGLRLGTTYEPAEVTIAAGGSILFYNPELVNIRNSEGEPFGVNRLHDLITRDRTDGEQLIESIVTTVQSFAGESSKILQGTVLLVLERKNAQLAT